MFWKKEIPFDLHHFQFFTINLPGISYLPLQEQAVVPPGVFVLTGCARYFGGLWGPWGMASGPVYRCLIAGGEMVDAKGRDV